MPIAGPVLGGLIISQFAAQGFTGPKQPQLAMALGNGIINSILATNVYQGLATGIGTGAGVGTGILIGLVGPIVGGNITAMMAAQGFTGVKMIQLANAVGNAFSAHMATGIVQSTSTPVAVGTGFGKILGVVGPAVGSSILGMMAAQGFTGVKMAQLAMAIGNGIANSMAIATVQTTIVGAGYPPAPLSGPEFGKLI